MSPDTFTDSSYKEFGLDWGGRKFDHKTLKRRLDLKTEFLAGDLGALVNNNKWESSGNKWGDDAILLMRKFYELPSPAVYLDNTGRKINFKNFNGDPEYDFLYGLNPKSIVQISFF